MNHKMIREAVKKRNGWSERDLDSYIKKAQLWHNPKNHDTGDDIREKLGVKVLWDEALALEGLGNRYYFPFHDYEMTDIEEVMKLFKFCRNWNRYYQVWKKYAPKGCRNEAIYLLAVAQMSVKGFKNEEKEMDKLRAQGYDVRKSTAAEDAMGIDAWIDGEPVQFKSERTYWDKRSKQWNIIR
jgi:hypothetical protein